MTTATVDLTIEQTEILHTIREFVDRDVLPNVSRYDHADQFPEPLVQTMKELDCSASRSPRVRWTRSRSNAYALIVEALSRGGISLSGGMTTLIVEKEPGVVERRG